LDSLFAHRYRDQHCPDAYAAGAFAACLVLGLIAALVVEPLPSPAVALITVTIVAVLSPWVLFSPADFAKPGFRLPTQALSCPRSCRQCSMRW
jgi:hypothetical protein